MEYAALGPDHGLDAVIEMAEEEQGLVDRAGAHEVVRGTELPVGAAEELVLEGLRAGEADALAALEAPEGVDDVVHHPAGLGGLGRGGQGQERRRENEELFHWDASFSFLSSSASRVSSRFSAFTFTALLRVMAAYVTPPALR